MIACYEHDVRVTAFHSYASDMLMTLVRMNSNGAKLPRYWDLIHPAEKENRTGDEIALDVLLRSGLHPRKRDEIQGGE